MPHFNYTSIKILLLIGFVLLVEVCKQKQQLDMPFSMDGIVVCENYST